jgi:vitamin B12 transporter
MRAYDSWKLVQIQRGRATVTGFSANRKSDLGVVYLFSDFGARTPREIFI